MSPSGITTMEFISTNKYKTKTKTTKETTEKYNNNKEDDSYKVLLSAINFRT